MDHERGSQQLGNYIRSSQVTELLKERSLELRAHVVVIVGSRHILLWDVDQNGKLAEPSLVACEDEKIPTARFKIRREKKLAPYSGIKRGEGKARVNWSRATKVYGWSELEEQRLLAYRKEGKSWDWIFSQFPNRTHGAIRTRWYMLQDRTDAN
jgi:Myb-like DNA-binding domain